MKVKYKILTSIAMLCLCQSALSSYRNYRPLYIGMQLGGSDLHYKHSEFSESASSINDHGWAGRLLAGVDINQNLGLEVGYTLYQNPEFHQRDAVIDFSQQSLDFLAKVSIPVSCNVNLYAKGGLSCVHRSDIQASNDSVIVIASDEDDHVRPTLGFGVSYGFNANVSGDIGYFHTFGTDDLKDIDFYGAGITFRVG